MTPDGNIPVAYRADLKDPARFFLAQSFAMKNKKVMHVSNASTTELQKFINLLLSAAYPVLKVYSVTK